MATFRHQRARNVVEVVGALFLASMALGRAEMYHSVVSLLVAALIAVYGVYRGVILCARNPALGYDESGVTVGQLFAVRRFKWSQVCDLRELHWKRPSIPYLNWLPRERHYLELLTHGAGPVKIRQEMIEQPPGGVKQVLDGFRAAQAVALGERGAAAARLGTQPSAQRAAPLSALQTERLQRLGIDTGDTETGTDETSVGGRPQVAAPSGPSRPVFGRRIS